jgi:hypothetical protein
MPSRQSTKTSPRKSARPAVVVEIAELIEAALQFFRAVALFLGNTLPWHIPAPLGVPRRIVRPSWALKAATEALVGVRLDDCDPHSPSVAVRTPRRGHEDVMVGEGAKRLERPILPIWQNYHIQVK